MFFFCLSIIEAHISCMCLRLLNSLEGRLIKNHAITLLNVKLWLRSNCGWAIGVASHQIALDLLFLFYIIFLGWRLHNQILALIYLDSTVYVVLLFSLLHRLVAPIPIIFLQKELAIATMKILQWNFFLRGTLVVITVR